MENMEVITRESDQQFRKQGGRHFQAIILAFLVGAFTLLFIMAMIFIRRALFLSVHEQWRFLVINLLLLAIISLTSRPLTSSSCNGRKDQAQGSENDNYQCGLNTNTPLEEKKEQERRKQNQVGGSDDDSGGEEEVITKNEDISGEEINERAEAFIAMFRRQHLVSDSRYIRHRITSLESNISN